MRRPQEITRTRLQFRFIALTATILAAAGLVWFKSQSHPTTKPTHPAAIAQTAQPEQTPEPQTTPPTQAPEPAVTAALAQSAATAAPSDEASLMDRLRSIQNSDPESAVKLAREGNVRFASSQMASERTSILIHALSTLGRGSEARGEAEDMVNRYVDSDWVREVERFTGAHRHRNVRLNDAGGLDYY